MRRVARGAGRDLNVAELRHLAVERVAVGRQVLGVAVAALLDHRGLERRRVVPLDRRARCGNRCRPGAARIAFVAQLAVLSLREPGVDRLMAAAAGFGYARAVHAARSRRSMSRMSCAPWQFVHVGASAARAPPASSLAVDAVVEPTADVAAGELRFLDELLVAVTLGAGRLEVRMVGTRLGILGAADVVLAVAVGARGGDRAAALARLPVHGLRVLLRPARRGRWSSRPASASRRAESCSAKRRRDTPCSRARARHARISRMPPRRRQSTCRWRFSHRRSRGRRYTESPSLPQYRAQRRTRTPSRRPRAPGPARQRFVPSAAPVPTSLYSPRFRIASRPSPLARVPPRLRQPLQRRRARLH